MLVGLAWAAYFIGFLSLYLPHGRSFLDTLAGLIGGLPFYIVMFPTGLARVFFPAYAGHLVGVGCSIYVVSWLVFVASTGTALFINGKFRFWIGYGFLFVFLGLNLVGCHLELSDPVTGL
jgi:hypothetical protein